MHIGTHICPRMCVGTGARILVRAHAQVMLHEEPRKAFMKGSWVPPGAHVHVRFAFVQMVRPMSA